MTEHEFPQVKPDDDDGVSLALEAGAALWSNDNHDEALRWLSKAADAAEQAGNDMRALELARSGADLRSLAQGDQSVPEAEVSPKSDGQPAASLADSDGLQRRGSLPPKPSKRPLPGTADASAAGSNRPPPPSSMRPAPSSAASTTGGSAGASGASASSPRSPSTVPGAPPKPSAGASQTPVGYDASLQGADLQQSPDGGPASTGDATTTTPLPSKAAAAFSTPNADTSSSKLDAVSTPINGDNGATSTSIQLGVGTEDARQDAESTPVASRSSAAIEVAPAGHDHGGPSAALPSDLESGISVAIKASARDDELFLVRLLAKGQAPPPGYKAAVIVTSDGSLG